MELNKSIKNALESIGSREDHMEEGIRGLENRNLEIILIEENRELRANKWKKKFTPLSNSINSDVKTTGIERRRDESSEFI